VWPGLAVRFVHQQLETGLSVTTARTKPWGTGHAVLAADGAVAGPFAVLNADDFYGRRAFERLAAALAVASGPEFSAVAWELRKTLSEYGGVSRALLRADRSGRLQQITELVGVRERAGRIEGRTTEGRAVTLTGRERVSMNLWGFTPAVFPLLRASFEAFVAARHADPEAEFFLSDAIDGLVAQGAATVAVLPTDAEWMGVTWAEDRPRVARRLAEMSAAGAYPVPLGGILRRGG
jgi:UTP-glucose-1-phosphate uridylyltransferase